MSKRNRKKLSGQEGVISFQVGLGGEAIAASLSRLRPRYTEMLGNLAEQEVKPVENSGYETQMAAAERVMTEDREALQKLAE